MCWVRASVSNEHRTLRIAKWVLRGTPAWFKAQQRSNRATGYRSVGIARSLPTSGYLDDDYCESSLTSTPITQWSTSKNNDQKISKIPGGQILTLWKTVVISRRSHTIQIRQLWVSCQKSRHALRKVPVECKISTRHYRCEIPVLW